MTSRPVLYNGNSEEWLLCGLHNECSSDVSMVLGFEDPSVHSNIQR